MYYFNQFRYSPAAGVSSVNFLAKARYESLFGRLWIRVHTVLFDGTLSLILIKISFPYWVFRLEEVFFYYLNGLRSSTEARGRLARLHTYIIQVHSFCHSVSRHLLQKIPPIPPYNKTPYKIPALFFTFHSFYLRPSIWFSKVPSWRQTTRKKVLFVLLHPVLSRIINGNTFSLSTSISPVFPRFAWSPIESASDKGCWFNPIYYQEM